MDNAIIFFDIADKWLKRLCMLLMLGLICIVLFNVISRYAFKFGIVGLQELEWHLFGAIFLLGMSISLYDDSHVRVDIFYSKLNPKKQALINLFGLIFFVLPLSLLILLLSLGYVAESFNSLESSPDPGGLSYRWIIKSMIPISFGVLIFFSIGRILRTVRIIKDTK